MATNAERNQPALLVIPVPVMDDQARYGATGAASEPVALENRLTQATKEA
jgi:hypothetical protein